MLIAKEGMVCVQDNDCQYGHCREVIENKEKKKNCMLRAKEGMSCFKDDDCDTGICSKGTFNKCLPKSYLVPILIAIIVTLLVIVLVLAFLWKRN